MTINDIELKDVLIGDVWYVRDSRIWNCHFAGYKDRFAMKYLRTVTIRWYPYIKTPLLYNFHAPQADIKNFLASDDSENVVCFLSALAYFFAKDVYQRQGSGRNHKFQCRRFTGRSVDQ